MRFGLWELVCACLAAFIAGAVAMFEYLRRWPRLMRWVAEQEKRRGK